MICRYCEREIKKGERYHGHRDGEGSHEPPCPKGDNDLTSKHELANLRSSLASRLYHLSVPANEQ